MKKYFFILLFFVSGIKVHSQELYFIKNTPVNDSVILFEFSKVDCSTNTITVLGPVPFSYYASMLSSCYDYDAGTYYYCEFRKMYQFDAATGVVIRSDTFNLPYPEHFYNIVFNPRDHCVYGIVSHLRNLNQWFARYNPATARIDTLYPVYPHVDIDIGSKSAIDPLRQQYFTQSSHLSCIDMTNGHVLYDNSIQNPLHEQFDHIAYSCNTEKLFGLSNAYHAEQEYFSNLDTTGIITHVNPDTLPVYYYKHIQSGSCIDQSSDIFYYPAAGGKLYGIDIHTGQIVYSHDYGPGFDFLYLQPGSNYHCPVADIDEASANPISVYPNPSSGKFTFELPLDDDYMDLFITDINGREILSMLITKQRFTIDLSTLPSGVYFYSLKGKNIYNGKLIKNYE